MVDDGSADGTAAVAERFAAARSDAARAAQSRQSRQRLRGAARHAGSEGEWALFSDADLSAPIEELEKLWQRRRGSRRAGGHRLARARPLADRRASIVRSASTAGRVFNLVMRADHRPALPRHAMRLQAVRGRRRARDFPPPALDGFGFDVEVLFIARRLGYREIEVPVRWNDVAGTKVSAWRGLRPSSIRCACAGTRSAADMREPAVCCTP